MSLESATMFIASTRSDDRLRRVLVYRPLSASCSSSRPASLGGSGDNAVSRACRDHWTDLSAAPAVLTTPRKVFFCRSPTYGDWFDVRCYGVVAEQR